jgi:hypothetical protein
VPDSYRGQTEDGDAAATDEAVEQDDTDELVQGQLIGADVVAADEFLSDLGDED